MEEVGVVEGEWWRGSGEGEGGGGRMVEGGDGERDDGEWDVEEGCSLKGAVQKEDVEGRKKGETSITYEKIEKKGT